MKIRTILSHLIIILSLCFLTFAVLDWYNPMMNFSGNTISSKLLLVLCVSAIALAVLTLLPQKQNLTGIFFVDPGQHFHHGGFTGAVLSDQRHHSAGINPQGSTG